MQNATNQVPTYELVKDALTNAISDNKVVLTLPGTEIHVKSLWEILQSGNTTLMTSLLNAGLDPNSEILDEYNAKFNQLWTTRLLIQAVVLKDMNMVHLLLKHGADLTKTDWAGDTALVKAVLISNLGIINMFLERGVTLKDINESFVYASKRPNCIGLLKILLDHGADMNYANQPYLNTALINAAKNGHFETVEFLLAQGVKVNVRDSNGLTPLMWATQFNFDKVGELLIQRMTIVCPKNDWIKDSLKYASDQYSILTKEILAEPPHSNTVAVWCERRNGIENILRLLNDVLRKRK